MSCEHNTSTDVVINNLSLDDVESSKYAYRKNNYML